MKIKCNWTIHVRHTIYQRVIYMIREKGESSINEIPWDIEQKNNYINKSESLISETISLKGVATRVVVNLSDNLQLVKKSETPSNPKVKAEEKVRTTNLIMHWQKFRLMHRGKLLTL